MIRDFDKLLTFDKATLAQIAGDFYCEIKSSAEGKNTSLPFIINPLHKNDGSMAQDTFQAMVIGGSYFQSVNVDLKNSEFIFRSKTELIQPAFHTKEDFLTFVDQNLDKNIRVLAMNFAYPVEPLLRKDRIDGILKTGTKEQEFTGLIHKKVGKTIEEYIKIKHNRTIKVLAANDAVCLLLAGLDISERSKLAGGIIGTGLNFSFFLDDKRIVNLEAGNFDKFPISEEALILDAVSSSPGTGLLEKEVSGRYLFELYNLITRREGSAADRIVSTKELSVIAEDSEKPGSDLAKALLKRSAMLTAAQISGICKYKESDMNFIMEGSLFWKGFNYKQQVSEYCELLSPEFKADFIKIEDSSLKGAAMLGVI